VKTIEDYAGGFGKGYTRAAEIWRGLLGELQGLGTKMHIILISHAKIKRFEDPNLPTGYDRYVLAINEQAAAMVRQAVDAVLFANFKEAVRQANKKPSKGDRGQGEAERALYTEHRPAFDAKNRFHLPFELPLEWSEFARRVKEFYAEEGPEAGPAVTAPLPGPEPEQKPIEPAGSTPEMREKLGPPDGPLARGEAAA
jgi:hypothetical protein